MNTDDELHDEHNNCCPRTFGENAYFDTGLPAMQQLRLLLLFLSSPSRPSSHVSSIMENRSDRSPSYATPLVATNTTSPIFSSLHYKHLKRRVVHHFPRERNLTLICFVSGVVFFFFSSIYIGSTYLQEHLQDEKYR